MTDIYTEAPLRLGKVIRSERKALKLSQEALAHHAQLNRTYMGQVERGEVNISITSLIRIANVLKIKLSVMLDKAGL